jgi:hypothetical protein
MKRVKLKHMGEKGFQVLKVPPGKDDLTTFVLEATKNSPSPYFLEGSVLLVNGKVTMRNLILQDGDEVVIYPPLAGG